MDHRSAAERCASCGAGLAPDAPWCSLCFAPVPVAAPVAPPVVAPVAAPVVARHEPEPPVQIAHVATTVPVRVAEPRSLYPEITPERLGRHARPAEPAEPFADEPFRVRPVAHGVPQPRLVEPASAVPSAPAAVAEVVEEDVPAWPCTRCGTAVPMSADVCTECGGRFLAGLVGTAPTLVLPVVGDITTKSPTQRYVIAAAVGLSAAFLVVGLIALVGAVF